MNKGGYFGVVMPAAADYPWVVNKGTPWHNATDASYATDEVCSVAVVDEPEGRVVSKILKIHNSLYGIVALSRREPFRYRNLGNAAKSDRALQILSRCVGISRKMARFL